MLVFDSVIIINKKNVFGLFNYLKKSLWSGVYPTNPASISNFVKLFSNVHLLKSTSLLIVKIISETMRDNSPGIISPLDFQTSINAFMFLHKAQSSPDNTDNTDIPFPRSLMRSPCTGEY